MSKMSLDRILQSQGFGSRKYCRELIAAGEVSVEGQPVDAWKTAFPTEGLQFTVFGEPWQVRTHLYLALNKPADFECSRKPSHHPGVMRLLPEQFGWRDVQSVGRLDHDTTGLLLLSDDGAFIHAMTSPRRHVPKVYLATTAAPVSPQLIEQLLHGVQLHDEAGPLRALSCQEVDESRLEIILEQGKYHQVRRMLAAAGNHCVSLQRIAIGPLSLASLGLDEGEWCYLEASQVEALMQTGA
ncbi:pseudouridine synthase [Lacisediminimonas sp.]|uniref:pseudouridine synthase n=1 Tax=Lacisediminimonas sp. TaxID=3060582 RepID=UPI002724A6E1|nr:pseudouridine synthase [Lacisediminimonas sp.]MDO8299953.1 pseudouridine synthase [Lacisediminimonas sp.]